MPNGDAPSPEELEAALPVTAEEAQAIADAMTPVQNLTDVGSAFGNTLEDAPGSGPKLMGSLLRIVSTHANLTSQSAEVVARALTAYVEAQSGGFQQVFPPPQEVAAQIQQTTEPLRELAEMGGPGDQLE